MIASELERLILERKGRGHIPFFVNCTSGTTVLGAFDPINDIADICQKYKLWLHIDVSNIQSLSRHYPLID
jgi:glutamate decarboxylase